MKYSVTTVGLPQFTMVEQAKFLQRLGFDGMELRVRRVTDEARKKPPSSWGYHINDITPENFKDKAPEIKTALADHGLELAGLASNPNCTDLEQIKLLLDGAVATGAPFIRVGAADGYNGTRPYREVYGETIAGYARVLELTRGTGVKIVLEIHGGTICPSASLAHRIVSNFSPADVGVIYDPQNMVKDGFETTALAIDVLGDYLAHLHVGAHKPTGSELDETGTAKWTWEACNMGEGLYDYTKLMAALKKADYRGFISIEDFRSDPPEERYGSGIGYLRRIETVA